MSRSAKQKKNRGSSEDKETEKAYADMDAKLEQEYAKLLEEFKRAVAVSSVDSSDTDDDFDVHSRPSAGLPVAQVRQRRFPLRNKDMMS